MLTAEQKLKYEKIYNNLVQDTMQYMLDNHIKTMVLGISGGIDSSVVAAICNDVYIESNGQIQLYGVALPSLTNEATENEAADAIMQSFCQQYATVKIDEAVESLVDLCNSSYLEMTTTAKGNIKARTRMIYLYNLAQLTHGVVMGAANKTELHLGFWTIHGSDSNDVCPIINLWKTEVYELAEYIRDYRLQDPEQIKALGLSIALTPTDGNGVVPGGDMAQIAPGYTYKEVDTICKHLYMYEHGAFRSEGPSSFLTKQEQITRLCMATCNSVMPQDVIRKVCDRWFNNKYKLNHPVKIMLH